jgi:coproporphyrinogen III oxidase
MAATARRLRQILRILQPTPTSILEKAGVITSLVHGTLSDAAIKQMRADHTTISLPENQDGGLPFCVAGVNLVTHPRNPHAPTVHANYRYFEITSPSGELLAWWFGGGSDLPSYLYEEDAVHFHSTLKSACNWNLLYPAFKQWCNEYFHITHRGESRGLEGYSLTTYTTESTSVCPPPGTPPDRPRTADEIFAFIQSTGRTFLPTSPSCPNATRTMIRKKERF